MSATHKPPKNGLTILIVDDEMEILKLLESMLVQYGYSVLAAKGADAAIECFRQMSRPPDLVLTDVVMPGMSGPMLVDHLLTLEPSLNVMFMSGYDDRQIVQRYIREKGFRLIPKPFTVSVLRSAIESVIGRPEAKGPGEART